MGWIFSLKEETGSVIAAKNAGAALRSGLAREATKQSGGSYARSGNVIQADAENGSCCDAQRSKLPPTRRRSRLEAPCYQSLGKAELARGGLLLRLEQKERRRLAVGSLVRRVSEAGDSVEVVLVADKGAAFEQGHRDQVIMGMLD